MITVLIIGIIISILFYFAYLDIRHELYRLDQKRDILRQEFIHNEYAEMIHRDIVNAFNDGKVIKATGYVKINDKIEKKVLTVTGIDGNITILDSKYAVSKSNLEDFIWEM